MFLSRVQIFAGLTGAALLLGGCSSSSTPNPKDYIKPLNARFLEHSECLMPDAPRFPYETSDPTKRKQMNALAAAQLLEAKEEKSIGVSRYTLTPIGERTGPRFCYGHRNVVSIDSSTPPVVTNGFPQTEVTYTYTIEDVPVWAKTAEVLAAFPEMAKAISGTSTGKGKLAKTMAGWTVPD
ncbi:MAG TPA: hypothetical protein VGC07_08235 [Granulicella sp.]